MTIPWLMNCPHSEDSWCLDCVKELGEKYAEARRLLQLLHNGLAYDDYWGFPKINLSKMLAQRLSQECSRNDEVEVQK